MKIIQKIAEKYWFFLPVDIEAKTELNREKSKKKTNSSSDEKHLIKTAKWIYRAQDSSGDNGVARAYNTAHFKKYGTIAGWQASYPETTGYIIPTLFIIAKYLNNNSFFERAVKMANWEIDIQLPSGAVMGGVVTTKPAPAVFNTGQVIFGWLAAYKQTNKSKYIKAAIKAGDYLLSVQASNGSWQKGNSKFALTEATIYNTRVAWALIELGLEVKEEKYILSGKKNIELALSKQSDSGWFSNNCLSNPENPLLHTIVYATRGILESGICINKTEYIQAALKTLDSLMKCQRKNGRIAGRLNKNWEPKVDWDCLTGDAQTAIAWLRAYAITGKQSYKDAARRTIDFIKSTQNLQHPNPGIRGGVKGSFPFDGKYGQFEMLNWAAKFFCDALMMINDKELVNIEIKG